MIWLIGGTSESVIVAKLIAQHQPNFIVSVTTDNACRLYDSIAVCQVFASKLTQNMIIKFIHQYHITAIVDCSHPFAQEISQSVITVCQSLNLPYLRYERPEVDVADSHSLISSVSSIESLVGDNSPLQGKRVLLTIGAKYLPLFRHYQSSAWLYARILPYPQSLTLAYQGGFTCDRLIALRPPISKELEKALWQLWQIEVVVTKAGGKAGGEDIKYQVAQALNIHLIVIPRPQVNYPQSTSNLGDVQKFISNSL